MRIVRIPKNAWLSALGVALLVVVLSMVGGSAGISQEEEADVCAGFDEAAYEYCTAYCEALDCDSPDPIGSAEACLATLDGFVALTGMAPPCEAPADE